MRQISTPNAKHQRQTQKQQPQPKADLLIALGVRFDDRVTGKLEAFATRARIVHIDIDPAEIHKNKAAHVPVCCGEGRMIIMCSTANGGEGARAGGAGGQAQPPTAAFNKDPAKQQQHPSPQNNATTQQQQTSSPRCARSTACSRPTPSTRSSSRRGSPSSRRSASSSRCATPTATTRSRRSTPSRWGAAGGRGERLVGGAFVCVVYFCAGCFCFACRPCSLQPKCRGRRAQHHDALTTQQHH